MKIIYTFNNKYIIVIDFHMPNNTAKILNSKYLIKIQWWGCGEEKKPFHILLMWMANIAFSIGDNLAKTVKITFTLLFLLQGIYTTNMHSYMK